MTTNSEEIPQSACIQNASSLGEALATTTIVSLDAEVLDLKVDEVIEASTSELGSSPQQSQLHSSTKKLEDGILFYKEYAALAGFDIRMSTTTTSSDGVKVWKYILCSREVARRNWAMFGDVLSFDATYETNRYNMVFTPFTGVDNHQKCVTFGAGLLRTEDIESYTWVFRQFQDAMDHDPKCIITDQDPSLHTAVSEKEICAACFSCSVVHVDDVEDKVQYTIKDMRELYVSKRWCKNDIVYRSVGTTTADYEKDYIRENTKWSINKLWSDIHACVALVEHDSDLLGSFSEVIRAQKTKLQGLSVSDELQGTKNKMFESFYGIASPSEVRVLPPEKVHNKGSGKRIKSVKELAIEQSKKHKRLCRTCNQTGFHDIRNCPLNKSTS
ncbi:unnamed protein product [Cuscuta campestris]|uniref:MULE transposase domain-containing protein n=1 Tax=Cuscuta campestris TaxID=132261 RepID=A0A484ND56_9ASTE|nr:unnamed protein product [Cuscuta campestris]